jgi:hypothetical protein
MISSRRKFLKETLFGTLLLSAAKLIPFDIARADAGAEIRPLLKFFSPNEFFIMQAVAERIVGTPPRTGLLAREVNVAFRADQFLIDADPEVQEQFHQLLTVFNGALFTFLFDFRFSSFINMSPEDQDSYLQSWMTSSYEFRRTAFQALKRISLSMFYTEHRSWNEIGYDGMFLPWERGAMNSEQ